MNRKRRFHLTAAASATTITATLDWASLPSDIPTAAKGVRLHLATANIANRAATSRVELAVGGTDVLVWDQYYEGPVTPLHGLEFDKTDGNITLTMVGATNAAREVHLIGEWIQD